VIGGISACPSHRRRRRKKKEEEEEEEKKQEEKEEEQEDDDNNNHRRVTVRSEGFACSCAYSCGAATTIALT
jgi:hypothetical protein